MACQELEVQPTGPSTELTILPYGKAFITMGSCFFFTWSLLCFCFYRYDNDFAALMSTEVLILVEVETRLCGAIKMLLTS